MLHKLKRRGAREDGVVAVIVAIMMVVFIGMGALAIDLGSFYQAQRHAQAAADAGALAASQDLPTSTSAASSDGTTYATTNDPGATATVTPDYSGNADAVKVSVTASPSFFGRFFGMTSANVSASAVAADTPTGSSCSTPGSGCYAIFAMDSTCTDNGVSLGGGVTITGGVHSNGSITTPGGGDHLGPTTYGTGCTPPSGGGDTFTAGPTAEAPITTWPINYALDFPACTGGACTGPGGTPSFCTQVSTATSETLKTYNPANVFSGNIYCDVGTGTAGTPSTWNGAITIDGGPVEDTFVAGSVIFGGGDTLTACGYATAGYTASACNAAVPKPVTTNYPLIYAVGTGTSINDSPGGSGFTGDMFAPNGTIDVGGGTLTTLLEAQIVEAPGGGFTGDGPSDSGTTSSFGGTDALLQ
jgi:Flp pilus assembly protein TadG